MMWKMEMAGDSIVEERHGNPWYMSTHTSQAHGKQENERAMKEKDAQRPKEKYENE